MKLIRFYDSKTKDIQYGRLEGEDIFLLENPYTHDGRLLGKEGSRALSEVIVLTPAYPAKALCVGLNYMDHAKELGLELPERPVIFIKPTSALLSDGGEIIYPELSHQVDYEAELCVVIGKKCHGVTREEAKDYILGYTCANDVTARDLQPKKGQWTVSKSFDTFLPMGPYIETDIDPSELDISLSLNGEIKQHSNTKNLIFDVPYLVSYLSNVMTLVPGDVICTGTPGGIGPMNKGDKVEVKIEGIGVLTNKVK